ncbi:MAG: hypothetical protein KDA74_24830, partial [Planctomycetaceae bacterium]|nr:hypothetical protein [Planctomycetaceae bacterium]
MNRISATFRIALGISSLSVSIVLLAATVGLVPDRRTAVVDGRANLCETLAVKCSLLAGHDDLKGIEQGLTAIVQRNQELVSAAIRSADGTLLASAGPHSETWQPPADGKSSENRMFVPIKSQGKEWGQLEAGFQPR